MWHLLYINILEPTSLGQSVRLINRLIIANVYYIPRFCFEHPKELSISFIFDSFLFALTPRSYKKWDTFDVNEALAEVENEDKPDEPNLRLVRPFTNVVNSSSFTACYEFVSPQWFEPTRQATRGSR